MTTPLACCPNCSCSGEQPCHPWVPAAWAACFQNSPSLKGIIISGQALCQSLASQLPPKCAVYFHDTVNSPSCPTCRSSGSRCACDTERGGSRGEDACFLQASGWKPWRRDDNLSYPGSYYRNMSVAPLNLQQAISLAGTKQRERNWGRRNTAKSNTVLLIFSQSSCSLLEEIHSFCNSSPFPHIVATCFTATRGQTSPDSLQLHMKQSETFA